jgi:capsular polysaccharide biosynthesis protein
VGVADVYRALWRHKFFILALTAGLVAAAWVLTSRQEKIYEAGTLIRIQQRVEPSGTVIAGLATGDQPAQTYAEIVQTHAIAQRIVTELAGKATIADVDISASPVEDLELLWVTASSPSPAMAQLVANAAPPALQAFIRETGTLRDRVVTVELAELPKDPAKPNLTLNLALAFLLGLVFNGALALLIETLSDPLPDPDRLEQLTGHPVLATIPSLRFTSPLSIASSEQQLRRAAKTPAEQLYGS